MKPTLSRPPRFSRTLYALGFTISAALLLFVGLKIERLLYENYVQELKVSATLKLTKVRDDVEESLLNYMVILRSLEAIIQQDPDITEKEFTRIAYKLRSGNDKILNIAAAPDLVVRYVYPLTVNDAAVGLDYRSTPDQATSVMKAVERRSPVVSAPVDLVQGGQGVILRHPVFVADGLRGRDKLWGMVAVVLDYDKFLYETGIHSLENDFDILVQSTDETGEARRTIIGNTAVRDRAPMQLDFEFPYGEWELMATPDGGWPPHSPSYLRDRVLIAVVGLLILAALGYVSYLSEARRRAQSRLVEALEAIDDGFVMFDHEDRLVMANARYKAIYDKISDLVAPGAKFEHLIRAAIRRGQQIVPLGEEEEHIRDRVKRHGSAINEVHQRLYDGRYIRATDRVTGDGGRVGLRVDLTALEEAREKAEAASRAKTDFIGTLSHELRTPLTVILGHVRLAKHLKRFEAGKALADTLDGQRVDAAQARGELEALFASVSTMMEKLERSGEHLLTLINEMLDFAKIESGTASVEIQEHGIDSIVEPIRDQMSNEVRQKGLAFVVSFTDGVVLADEVRTRQILFNLIGNALKFTSEGRIELTASTLDGTATFEVSDSGPGIPDADLERVFEAFQQVDNSATRESGGTGLGLAISKQLAIAQGGDLTVRSEVGVGTTFTLTLPGPLQASRAA